ncbi:PHP domain-containing protein [Methanolobus vulcani]|uniref:PHP domain-containing protein n=1 Tax=Methanolobus vulcani TaxID=38026 RepID=A0A7Z8KPX8_9EURY|nr:PHP domain-containing protein [Methanolobus vulcani]TQD27257.1 PHP domain-containing protein [Methanolobus vulcani]
MDQNELDNLYKYDLHVHSIYSYDSLSTLKNILKKAKSLGLDGLAITDHDTIKGSLKMSDLNKQLGNPLNVIIGSEIKTNLGDVIGLFLSDEIVSRNFEDVLDEIHNQNGFAILPHPYKTFEYIPQNVLKQIDAIEIFNARIPEILNNKSNDLVMKTHMLYTGGSDAHMIRHVGKGLTAYSQDIGPLSVDNIKIALKNPCIYGEVYSRKYRYYTVAVGNIRKKKIGHLSKIIYNESKKIIADRK